MLQRHIEIGQDLLAAGHHLDQPVGDIARVRVHDADPVHVRHGVRQVLQQDGQPVLQAQVMAVVGGVLRDQHQLAHALHRAVGAPPARSLPAGG